MHYNKREFVALKSHHWEEITKIMIIQFQSELSIPTILHNVSRAINHAIFKGTKYAICC